MFKNLKNTQSLLGDLIAGFVVTLLLIPQSLAYALLAGLPAVMGLFAALPSLLIYAILGRSSVQSVGPMATTSLMVATVLATLAPHDYEMYIHLAIMLALLSGLMLMLMGILRLGFLADFLSQPVLAAFTIASAVLIASAQILAMIEIKGPSATLLEAVHTFIRGWSNINTTSFLLGCLAVMILIAAKYSVPKLFKQFDYSASAGAYVLRVLPVLLLGIGVILTKDVLEPHTVKVVGALPADLFQLKPVTIYWDLLPSLMLPAFLIALINYIQSISVVQTYANLRSEKMYPNQELIALGASNVGSALAGGFPVTGGLSRTVVNVQAGAKSQWSSVFTFFFMLLMLFFFTDVLAFIPLAILAATIFAAIISQIQFSILKSTLKNQKADAIAFIVTFTAVLLSGVQVGITVGLFMSLAAWIWLSRKPHIAELGLLPGTQHFRNILRYPDTKRLAHTQFIRIDENLYFGNASYVSSQIEEMLLESTKSLVLVLTSVSRIDYSAQQMLERLDKNLNNKGICLYFSELKGPVADRLKGAELYNRMQSRIYLSNYQTWINLSVEEDYTI